MRISPLGDQALLVTVAAEVTEEVVARVQQAVQAVAAAHIDGVQELVPAAASFGVMLTGSAERERVESAVRDELGLLPKNTPALEGQERDVPVCYGGDWGPDLQRLAQHLGGSLSDAIKAHSSVVYRVNAIGFAPGFAYLGGLPPRLHLPRRATPRARVAAGSVGIGGAQTGIYPLETPGGWQLLGRTPRHLFEPMEPSPAWLQRGDRVRFRPVDRAEFNRLAHVMAEARREALPAPPLATAGAVVEVLRAGVQTTVQDLGRSGWQAHGVPAGGAADPIAAHLANLLVGNPTGAALLEWARRGPVLHFREERVVAVTGIEPQGWPSWRPRLVKAGETIDLTHAHNGMRGYLAIAGGLEVPVVLGSRSTCLAGRFGGYWGRALRVGDQLAAGPPAVTQVRPGWFAALAWEPRQPDVTVVRVVRGPHVERFASWAWRVLTESTFHAQAESDRMGLRLDGATLLVEDTSQLVSGPIAVGAVQVPPDGRPIVLLADRQTLGGYPQIAYVISADWPRLAQIRPQGRVRFEEVSLGEAEQARHEQRRVLAVLGVGLAEKMRPVVAAPSPAPAPATPPS